MSDPYFVKEGGDLRNIAGTITPAMKRAREASLAPQFLSVVQIDRGCTATWIGDETKGREKYSYFLTAAHCPRPDDVGNFNMVPIDDWSEKSIAPSGVDYFIHPKYPPGNRDKRVTTDPAHDIAIARVSNALPILDQRVAAIAPPTLYSGDREHERSEMWFAGYGQWNVLSKFGNPKSGFKPGTGTQRAAGSGKLNAERGDLANLLSAHVGNVVAAPGDSGSAWWQQQADGSWSIIAVTAAGNGKGKAIGPRISHHLDWIKSIYPGVKVSNPHAIKINAAKRVHTHWETEYDIVGYVFPDGKGTDSIRRLTHEEIASFPTTSSTIKVPLTNTATGKSAMVAFQAWRDSGCGERYLRRMNNVTRCGPSARSRLILEFDPKATQPSLEKGLYTGNFSLEARGAHDFNLIRTIPFEANIEIR
jgi:hypothetical protein